MSELHGSYNKTKSNKEISFGLIKKNKKIDSTEGDARFEYKKRIRVRR